MKDSADEIIFSQIHCPEVSKRKEKLPPPTSGQFLENHGIPGVNNFFKNFEIR